MKTENKIKLQLEEAYENFKQINKVSLGSGGWHRMKGYIDALEWVLDQDSEGSP